SRNAEKVKRYLANYERLRLRMSEIEAQDHLRNWQPPVDGQIIMDTFNLPPGRMVGIIKDAIREAILEGDIPNEYEAAHALMLELGKEQGLTA
ncbi:MAG: tRNA nucleotidyltransferase, partial [Bacteroidota bacterium]